VQKLELKNIITTQTPKDSGIDRNLWTGEVIIELLKTKWNIDYKDSRIYQILDELGLSHQKAHRDYANSDPQLRKIRREIMEKK
jgi:transposase